VENIIASSIRWYNKQAERLALHSNLQDESVEVLEEVADAYDAAVTESEARSEHRLNTALNRVYGHQDAAAEAQAKANAEEQAQRDKAKADRKAEAQVKAQAKAEAKAKREAEVKAKAQAKAEAKAKREAEAQAKADQEAMADAELQDYAFRNDPADIPVEEPAKKSTRTPLKKVHFIQDEAEEDNRAESDIEREAVNKDIFKKNPNYKTTKERSKATSVNRRGVLLASRRGRVSRPGRIISTKPDSTSKPQLDQKNPFFTSESSNPPNSFNLLDEVEQIEAEMKEIDDELAQINRLSLNSDPMEDDKVVVNV